MTRPLALLLARRALVLWALVHLAATAALTAASVPPSETVGPGMPLLATAACAADVVRRGERTLLANLGVGLPTVLGLALAAAALAEWVLGTVVR